MAAMSWLDRAKVWLGILDEEDAAKAEAEASAPPRGGAPGSARSAALERVRGKRGDRPALDGVAAASQEMLEDALAAREAGNAKEMWRLLRQLDRGRGLRTVLRAAAALEAGDEAELGPLLPRVRVEEPPWWLPLQIAGALGDEGRAAALRARAEAAAAPPWALAWARALSPDDTERRRGLVELLFADAALARTVAARDLAIAGAEADPDAAERYVGFAHGRECIRRFGAEVVADLYERAQRP
jgi:hypothetical protein